ncbi:hypothetical protein PWKp5_00093 [Klebsiella phage PWKp5]|nr:hypothetical protein PWKp5_00093 [Klebsiella phage PWKp5]
MNKLLYGVGLNDVGIPLSRLYLGRKSYDSWANMLYRCYDPKFHLKYPTYSDCSVCREWWSFNNFHRWFIENYVDGYQLDKDLLLPGNKVYSPTTCVYIPHWLNSFTTNKTTKRGKQPIGVTFSQGRYVSHCNNPFTRKQEHIGSFSTPEEAYCSWLERKLQHALDMKENIDAVDTRLFDNVLVIIRGMK